MSPSRLEKFPLPRRERLEFIECLAAWEGSVGPTALIGAFGVSPAQASNDFRAYREICPGNLVYDPSRKSYIRGREFEPIGRACAARDYLPLLQSASVPLEHPLTQHLAKSVPYDELPSLDAPLPLDLSHRLFFAIVSANPIEVRYQSMTDPEPTARVIWPHAFVHIATRWHVRAFDELRDDYRDFVLPRFLMISESNPTSRQDLPKDKDWVTKESIEIVPNPAASVSQREVIVRQFGMCAEGSGWVRKVDLRRCLIPYFLHEYRLDEKPASVASHPIVLTDNTLRARFSWKSAS